MRVIPQGLELDEVAGGDAARFRARHACAGPIVAHIAALCADKGTQTLLEAWPSLSPKATLVLLGHTTREFAAWFESLPAQRRRGILHLQRLPDAERNDLLAAMDVLALPSRTDTFGRVFLEAWSYAKPVVGARAGGIPDVIEAGRTGELVDFGDAAGLARVLDGLLGDPRRREQMGLLGQRVLWERYDWQRVQKSLLELFETAASGLD